MSGAADVLWRVADELETAPALFEDLPERARLWMLAWLALPRVGCEHAAHGVTLFSAMGARRALCAPCAHRARLIELVSHCGRCGAPSDGAAPAVHAIYAIAPNLIAAMTVCGACMTDERNTT